MVDYQRPRRIALLCDSRLCVVRQMLYRASVNEEAPSTKEKESEVPMNTFLLLFSGVAVTVVFPCLIANIVRDYANRSAHLF